MIQREDRSMTDELEREMESKTIWKKFGLYEPLLVNYYEEIKKMELDPLELINKMNSMYYYIKCLTSEFLMGDEVHEGYRKFLEHSNRCENLLSDVYITETAPEICDLSSLKEITERNPYVGDPNEVLNWIVSNARVKLCEKYKVDNLTSINTLNNCKYVSDIIKSTCDELGVDCKILTIYPGFERRIDLIQGCGFHAFNIVKIFGKRYIVDCSYRQFFAVRKNCPENLGVLGNSGIRPGTFMLLTEERKKVADTLLKKGWIELNEETGKHYFDGFALAFRNGIFYEETEDFSFTTPYALDDYISFLKCLDSQLKHEPEGSIGRQKKVLRNPEFKFAEPFAKQ